MLLFGMAGREDAYSLAPWTDASFPVLPDPTGRTLVHPGLVAGETTAVFIAIGQSNIACHEVTTYSPTNATKVQNLSIYNGGLYQWASPVLGCTTGATGGGTGSSWLGRLGDKVIDNGWFDRVIIVPVALAGTACAAWASGGAWNHRIGVAAQRLSALGLTPTAVLWKQGETDKTLGTSQAAYAASLASVIQTFRDEGITAPFFVAKCTRQNDGSTSAAVQAAQVAAENHGAGIWLGPDSDAITGRDVAGHFNATGSDNNAAAWVTALGLYGAPFAT